MSKFRFSLVAILGLAASSVFAQREAMNRRGQDLPEIVVEAMGRFGACDQLSFSPQGDFLAAGGDDKVVRLWGYTAKDGLASDANILRWPSWREQRGGVKSFAFSPDGKRVAIGGFGMMPSNVAIVERETRNVAAITWPRPANNERFGTVKTVAFHPDGKRVAFGTYDGTVWIWDPKEIPIEKEDGRTFSAPLRVGKHVPMENREFNEPLLIFFTDANTMITVATNGDVISSNLNAKLSDSASDPLPPTKKLFNVNDGQPVMRTLMSAIASPDGKTIYAGGAGPQVLVRSTDGKASMRLDLPPEHFPQCLAVHPKSGKLAVGVGKAMTVKDGVPRFFMEANNTIRIYDAPATDAKPSTTINHNGPVESLAFHPTEARLAIAGGDADEVTLLDLNDVKKPVSVIRGFGRKPWGVALSENGNVLGVQVGRDADSINPNARGSGDWSRFDLARMTVTQDTKQKWVTPLQTADGWTVIPDAKDRRVWHVEMKIEGVPARKFRLGLDPDRDLSPNCFAFLATRGAKPTRLIVGHYYGCSLFDLNPGMATKDPRNGDMVMPKSRLFTGHGAEVTSIATAGDGTWFVTGGADQTVAAWSLKDWAHHPALGASFAIVDEQVSVADVAIGSPGWEAGLRVGDFVELLAVGGKRPPVYDRRKGANVGDRGAALKALATAQSGPELYFGIKPKKGDPWETLTTVRQRPLWKWFPAFNDENRLQDWVVWMWNGSFYHTKTAHGDRLVGWHVNGPTPAATPNYHQLQKFEKQFHRPEVILKLIGTRDIAAALTDAVGENPQLPKFGDYEPAPVRLALKNSEVNDKGIDMDITIRPRGKNPDLLPERVEVWVNDYRHVLYEGIGRKEFVKPLNIPATYFRPGSNQISVLSFNSAGGRAEDMFTVSSPNVNAETNLYGLAFAVNDYSDHRKISVNGVRSGFGDLNFARNDAEKFAERIHDFRGPNKFFVKGGLDLQLDAQAKRASLQKKLAELAKTVKPNDQVVLFFAGHGDLIMATDAKLAPGENGSRGSDAAKFGNGLFVFCCTDYSSNDPEKTGVSSDEIFEALAKINCKKLVLVDACHSGQASDANVLRKLIPHSQGPTVFTACNQGEKSYEDPTLKHGVFTYAILEGMGAEYRKADANTDGNLSAEELFKYISKRKMPELLKKQGKDGHEQTPTSFPLKPSREVLLKK